MIECRSFNGERSVHRNTVKYSVHRNTVKYLDNSYFSSYIRTIADDGCCIGKLSHIFIQ